MPQLPVLSGMEVRKALENGGWIFKRQKGSHMILIKIGRFVTLSVPDHKELDRGTLRSLISKAELSVEEFMNLLG